MSLSTRIAIGPSRCLAFAEAAMIAGAITATAATVAAHALADTAPGALWLVTTVAALAGAALAGKRWTRRLRTGAHEVFVDERTGFCARRLGDDAAPQPFELTDAAMVWPYFAVLSWSSTATPGSRDRLDIAVLRGEMHAGDAWRLHRFLRWAQRGGQRAAGPIGSIGKGPLG